MLCVLYLPQVAGLKELYASRRGSALQQLATFPAVVASTLTSLVGDVRTTSRNLAKCASVVSRQASKLPAYLDATDELVTNFAGKVDKLGKQFFADLEEMMVRANEMLSAIAILREGKALTDALRNATGSFNPLTYGALGKEITKLSQVRCFSVLYRFPPPHLQLKCSHSLPIDRFLISTLLRSFLSTLHLS